MRRMILLASGMAVIGACALAMSGQKALMERTVMAENAYRISFVPHGRLPYYRGGIFPAYFGDVPHFPLHNQPDSESDRYGSLWMIVLYYPYDMYLSFRNDSGIYDWDGSEWVPANNVAFYSGWKENNEYSFSMTPHNGMLKIEVRDEDANSTITTAHVDIDDVSKSRDELTLLSGCIDDDWSAIGYRITEFRIDVI